MRVLLLKAPAAGGILAEQFMQRRWHFGAVSFEGFFIVMVNATNFGVIFFHFLGKKKVLRITKDYFRKRGFRIWKCAPGVETVGKFNIVEGIEINGLRGFAICLVLQGV